ncbi:MAG: hypothetical protein F4Z04_00950 [Acidobacteria bacterium]|nr:hypothetical protein [Acidobacteriota bacterium]
MTAFWKATGSAFLLLSATACTSYFEVPIETPLQPKLDVGRFQRILVAGFLAGGSEDVDANLETSRLLRSQLRSESRLEVIDAEVLDLLAVAEMQGGGFNGNGDGNGNGNGNGDGDVQRGADDLPLSDDERAELSEEDLESFEHIFANVSYWRQLGEEHQNPLIVTGTVHFTPHQRSGMVTREREIYDEFGRRRVVPVRTYRDRSGFVLSPTFIFIDGSTGITLYTERHREEVLYESTQNTPALSSYFELMDRLLPSFLGALADQSIRGTRIMLK